MNTPGKYEIHTEVQFQPLQQIDIGMLADECERPWFNQTLCQVNDCVARIGVICGEFHWHQHDREDEMFYVLEGQLLIDLKQPERTVQLLPRQAFVVPRGVQHRTRAPVRTVILMFEGSGIVPTGD